MYVVVVLFVVFLFSGFSSPLSPLLLFITVCLVSLCCFKDEVEDPYANQTYICNSELNQKRAKFRASTTGLSPQ